MKHSWSLAYCLFISSVTLSCRGPNTEPHPEATPTQTTARVVSPPPRPTPVSAPLPLKPSRPWRLAAAERVVAIGDIHGDLAATQAALQLGGAIDATLHWAGGKLVVVQTGDQLDRGDDERPILDFLDSLGKEAERAGGAVHVLNGNHELMNVLGDFRYVTPHGFAAFSDVAPLGRTVKMVAAFPDEQRGRAAAFLPGGPFAVKLAERNAVLMVGDTVFVHGGVLPEHLTRGIDTINEELRQFMRGDLPAAPPSAESEESPLWTRRYSHGDPSQADCPALAQVLKAMGGVRMVVGHTPQKSGITSACDEQVWRIDTGMARAYGGPPAVLEIMKGHARAISAATPTSPSPP